MNRASVVAGLTRAMVVAATGLAVAATVLALRYRLDPAGVALAALVLACESVPLVGAAVVRSDPRNPTGWILLVCGVSVPLAVSAYLYSHAAADGANLVAARWAEWLDSWPWTPALTVVPTVGLLLFPDGRAASRRWRWLVRVAVAVNIAQLLNGMFAPHLLDYPTRANPTAWPGVAGSVADGLGATIVAVPILVTLAAWSVHQRYRAETSPDRRAALRIVTPAAWLIVASWWSCGVVIVTTGDSNNALIPELAGVAVLAVAAWIAIRRYGLFDTRQVLSRTLVYASLSGCVLALYLGVAAVIDEVTSDTAGGAAAAVAAVLAAVPLRTVLQRLANRVVYGDRDDPYAALERLGHRLADAAAPDDVLPGVARSIRQALRLPYVEIQLAQLTVEAGVRGTDVDRFPLVFAGERIGTLVAGHRDAGRPFADTDRHLLSTVATQIASAAHAVSLIQDLRQSRERLVSATEEERRRIRRDLHDGLGPALAGVVLGLHRARRHVDADPPAAVAQLEELTRQTQTAIADVRRLVYDLRPPALDELGLVGALTEQARNLGAILVDGPQPLPPLPAAVEVAAYRIALEAMTNVTRHAHADEATVTIVVDGAVHLQIADDGDGLPAGYRSGVGITSMHERAAELGGHCTIEPATPRGTLVRATIPLVGA